MWTAASGGMVITAAVLVWLGISPFFCLALGQAAGRSGPRPETVDDLIATQKPATCEATPPATVSLKPTFIDRLALCACQPDQGV